jgi:monoamine oxidase/V8-like Glu-specific endopeptidase
MSRSLYAMLHSRFGAAAGEDCATRVKAKIAREQYQWQLPELPAACAARLKKTSVAVVGAGFAGLAAARLLARAGVDVTVFEAKNRVGGRVHSTDTIAKGRVIEAGAELIGTFHVLWRILALEYGLAWISRMDDALYGCEGLTPRIFLDKFLDDAEQARLAVDMEVVLDRINRDADQVGDPMQPWLDPALQKFDRLSVADKLKSLGLKPPDRVWKAFELMLTNNNVAPLDQLGYLGLLCLVKGGELGSGPDRLWAYWRELEIFRAADGCQELAKAMANEIRTRHKRKILLQTVVRQIELGARAKLTYATGAGGTPAVARKEFDYVVLAIPPSVWKDVVVKPHQPGDPGQVGVIGMGPAAKFFSVVKNRFWVRDGAAPYGGSPGLGQVWEGTDNQTRIAGQDVVLSVFTGTRIPSETGYRSGLAKLFPDYTANLVKSRLVDWSKEPHIKTGYAAPRPGEVMTVGKKLSEPFAGRLFFAGEHTHMAFYGYMEGALRSGARAALQLIRTACDLPAAKPPQSPARPPVRVAMASPQRERASFEREMDDVLGRAGTAAASEREIIGRDARRGVSDSFAIPFRFVCHLEINYQKTRTTMGATGVLVGPRHVLTAAHNLHTENGLTVRKIAVSPARNGAANSIGAIAAARWAVHPNWDKSKRTNRNFDYALVTLDSDVGTDTFQETGYKPLGYWGDPSNGGGTVLVALAPANVDGRTAYLAGYPGKAGNNEKMLQGSGRAFGYQPGRPINAADLLLQHDIDTSSGQSGAPVWIQEGNGGFCLVGLHVSPGRRAADKSYTSNFAVRLNSTVITQIKAWMKP